MNAAALLTLLVKGSIITLMVGLGLELEVEALTLFRKRPWLILRVVLGTCVLVPLVALVMLKLPFSFQISKGARFGIGLMALSPSAPLTLRKAGRRGGDRHLAALLQVLAALTAIVSIPLLTDGFRAVYRVDGWTISPTTVALQVALVQVLPLSIGLLLRHRFPRFGARWALPIQKAAFLVNVAAVGLVLIKLFPKLLTFFQENITALPLMVFMTTAALAIGYLLGGHGPRERTTTALVTAMRNPGLALLFAITQGEEIPGVKWAIVTYLFMTILVSIPFLLWSGRRTISAT